MQRIAVKSSNIAAVGWEDDTLLVEFKSKKEGEPNRTYSYAHVPHDAFRQLLNAPSVGSYFATVIKPMYEGHRIDNPKEKQDAQDSQEKEKGT